MPKNLSVAALAVALALTVTACGEQDPPEANPAPAPAPLSAAEQTIVDQAVTQYTGMVQAELGELVTETDRFVQAVKAGQDDEARVIYPQARMHWERVETIAASFGDLDPAIDAREAGLGQDEEWTGWHRLEKDLWPERAEDYTPLTDQERASLADKLLADTQTIEEQSEGLQLTVTDIVEGSQGLLEEVAAGKVTGEEEYWSRTDLWDFQANIDGARTGFSLIQPVVRGRDRDLAAEIGDEFDVVQSLLDETRRGRGFVSYDRLTTEQVTAFSDAVNALGESLSEVSAVVG